MLFSSMYIATRADVEYYHHSAVGSFENWEGEVQYLAKIELMKSKIEILRQHFDFAKAASK